MQTQQPVFSVLLGFDLQILRTGGLDGDASMDLGFLWAARLLIDYESFILA